MSGTQVTRALNPPWQHIRQSRLGQLMNNWRNGRALKPGNVDEFCQYLFAANDREFDFAMVQKRLAHDNAADLTVADPANGSRVPLLDIALSAAVYRAKTDVRLLLWLLPQDRVNPWIPFEDEHGHARLLYRVVPKGLKKMATGEMMRRIEVSGQLNAPRASGLSALGVAIECRDLGMAINLLLLGADTGCPYPDPEAINHEGWLDRAHEQFLASEYLQIRWAAEVNK